MLAILHGNGFGRSSCHGGKCMMCMIKTMHTSFTTTAAGQRLCSVIKYSSCWLGTLAIIHGSIGCAAKPRECLAIHFHFACQDGHMLGSTVSNSQSEGYETSCMWIQKQNAAEFLSLASLTEPESSTGNTEADFCNIKQSERY